MVDIFKQLKETFVEPKADYDADDEADDKKDDEKPDTIDVHDLER